jgi:hypothetical protein
MTKELRERHVSIAHLVRKGPDLIEIQYTPGCLFNSKNGDEERRARQELMGTVPNWVISLIPEDADFELAAMHQDHFASDRSEGSMKAMALVTAANMMEMMLKLYFSYYPQLARLRVMDNEEGAREWLRLQMEEVARTVR